MGKQLWTKFKIRKQNLKSNKIYNQERVDEIYTLSMQENLYERNVK